jgi:hypothetical protein
MHYLYAGNERIISMLDWFPFAVARASESGRWRLPIIQLFNFLSDRHRGMNRNSSYLAHSGITWLILAECAF